MAYREQLIQLISQFKFTTTIAAPVFSEYTRRDWTFHAKGLWVDELLDNNNDIGSFQSPISSFTMIGSSNFSYRSLNLDSESQLAVWTNDPRLKRRMRAEVEHLFSSAYCSQAVCSQLMADSHHRFPWYLRPLLPLLHRYM